MATRTWEEGWGGGGGGGVSINTSLAMELHIG